MLHTLRHSFATHLLECGVDIRVADIAFQNKRETYNLLMRATAD